MLALYKMLVFDSDPESEFANLQKLVYSLFYMDNGGFTTNDERELRGAKDYLVSFFEGYGFQLQQFATNSESLQEELDRSLESPTPNAVKLFGIQWNRPKDVLFAKPVTLDPLAN